MSKFKVRYLLNPAQRGTLMRIQNWNLTLYLNFCFSHKKRQRNSNEYLKIKLF